MDKLRDLLRLNEDQFNPWYLLVLVLVAYAFAIGMRMLWVGYIGDNAESFWNGQIMINTNDGYFYAEGARDILAGGNQPYDLSPIGNPTSQLTAWLAKVLPFSFETIILYMPAWVGALIVVPVLLIGRALKQTWLGFGAALIAGIAWSYYNRTMTGYYDTDMLVIVLPTLVLWSLILGVSHHQNRYLLITTFTIILYGVWYPGSYSLNLGMAAMLLLYTLIFDRKNIFNYKLLIFMAIAVVMLPIMLKFTISILLLVTFYLLKERIDLKIVLGLLGASVVVLAITGGLGPIFAQLTAYVFRGETAADASGTLHYFNVVQTVREAGDIPFDTFANRISGHVVSFILATIGYILMVIRYPVMLIALPMVGLGFIAYTGGLRFTVYAVPAYALGISFLIFWIAQQVGSFAQEGRNRTLLWGGAAAFGTALVLIPNIKHITEYKVPTVFTAQEVQVLDTLGKKASREDYVLAWWDYGYPIRYYSDVKTLVDGGKHSGDVNFPVSFSLTFPQTQSVNMARLATEYTEKAYHNKTHHDYLKSMMEDYQETDPDIFLSRLEHKSFQLPEKTRDVYFYLPYRMMDIYQTVRLFSNLNLRTGAAYARPFIYESRSFKDTGEKILLGNGIEVDKRTNRIRIGQQEVSVNALYMTAYGPDGKLQVRRQLFDMSAPLSLIFMRSYNRFMVVDQQTLNSTYFQLFVLESYDPELFEPVILTPLAKVYKLNR